MKALITGSSGFAGSALANELSFHGNEVFGVDTLQQEALSANSFLVSLLDRERLRQVFEFAKPDVVFHLSADEDSLLQGTRNLIELAGKARVLIVGSSEVYGNPEHLPAPETASLHPLTPTAELRAKQEELAADYAGKGFDIVLIRSFPLLGPGETESVCSDLARQIAEVEKGKRTSVQIGNLYVVQDFTDARDAAGAYALLAERGKRGEAYNVCSGRPAFLKELFRLMASFSSSRIVVEDKKEPLPAYAITQSVGDNSKLKGVTGWQPRIPLRQTLQDMLDFWRART